MKSEQPKSSELLCWLLMATAVIPAFFVHLLSGYHAIAASLLALSVFICCRKLPYGWVACALALFSVLAASVGAAIPLVTEVANGGQLASIATTTSTAAALGYIAGAHPIRVVQLDRAIAIVGLLMAILSASAFAINAGEPIPLTVAILDPEYVSSDYPYVVEYQSPKTMEKISRRTYEREFVVEVPYPEGLQKLTITRTFCLDGRDVEYPLEIAVTDKQATWELGLYQLMNIVSGGQVRDEPPRVELRLSEETLADIKGSTNCS